MVHMVENNEKCLKIIKKVLFSSYARETHVRLTQEHEEKCSFLAFRSDSQTLVDTQKLVAPQQFHFFDNFQVFFIVFDHVHACARLRLLVKINNIPSPWCLN